MFSDPGFWIMMAGALLIAFGFLGLAISRMGKGRSARSPNRNVKQELPTNHGSSMELPNPFSTEAKQENGRSREH